MKSLSVKPIFDIMLAVSIILGSLFSFSYQGGLIMDAKDVTAIMDIARQTARYTVEDSVKYMESAADRLEKRAAESIEKIREAGISVLFTISKNEEENHKENAKIREDMRKTLAKLTETAEQLAGFAEAIEQVLKKNGE